MGYSIVRVRTESLPHEPLTVALEGIDGVLEVTSTDLSTAVD